MLEIFKKKDRCCNNDFIEKSMLYANSEIPQLLSIHKVHEFSIFHDSMTFSNIRCNIDKKCTEDHENCFSRKLSCHIDNQLSIK